jgi:hypothetical protein
LLFVVRKHTHPPTIHLPSRPERLAEGWSTR